MKRDWKLIRKVLLALEAEAGLCGDIRMDSIDGYPPEVVCYHIMLLDRAGMIDADISETIGSHYAVARCMTWNGHELLDSIRTDAMWNRIVTKVRDKGLELSFQTISSAAAGIIKGLLS